MNKVSQENIEAGGDVVGRDKIQQYFNSAPKGMVERLLARLHQQVQDDEQTRETIDELARYHRKRSIDGVEGLEAKLNVSGRGHCYMDAIEKKEMFAKLLEKWSLYESAQQIFVHILAKAENEFNSVIYLQIPERSEHEVNAMVFERIVEPIVNECGSDFFAMNYNVVQGMVYWLAEQCFIRWHRTEDVVV